MRSRNHRYLILNPVSVVLALQGHVWPEPKQWRGSEEQRQHLLRIGHLGGKSAAESGLLAKAREKAYSNPEHGRKGGQASVESGHLFNMAKKDTKPELAVKAKLDELGVHYVHQYLLNGKFNVDFYLPDFNTIIEVDGCYWHGCKECGFAGVPKNTRKDPSRNAYILACGYRLEIIKEHEMIT